MTLVTLSKSFLLSPAERSFYRQERLIMHPICGQIFKRGTIVTQLTRNIKLSGINNQIWPTKHSTISIILYIHLMCDYNVWFSLSAFGDVFSVIGVREPQAAASEAFVKFAEAHRNMEKFGIQLLKTIKPVRDQIWHDLLFLQRYWLKYRWM